MEQWTSGRPDKPAQDAQAPILRACWLRVAQGEGTPSDGMSENGERRRDLTENAGPRQEPPMAFRCTKSSEEPFIDRHFWMFIDSLEQTTHMRGVVAEPKLPSDHYGYP